MDRKTVLLFAISIAILVIMLYFVGIDNVVSALKDADKGLILLAVIIQFITFVLYTYRWQLISGRVDINVSLKKLLPMTLLGLAINNITPSGRGGGEPVRGYVLSKETDTHVEDAFATVVADRALDTFPFIVLAAVTVIGVTFYIELELWIVIVMILAVFAIIALLIMIIYMSINHEFGLRVNGWILKLVRRFYKKNTPELEEKITSAVLGFQDTMSTLLHDRKILGIALPLSLGIWFIEILRVYLVFLAFGVTVSPITIAEVFILAILVGMIPLLPGGIGAVDGIMIIFYSAAGISPSVAAAATVVERLISFWLPTILGMLTLPYYGSSILSKASLSSSKDKSIEEGNEE